MKSFAKYENKRNSINLEQYSYYVTYYKYNWHKDIELLILLNGEIEVNKNGESHILSKGDVILINSNIGHATMARKPDSIAMVIHFDPVYFSTWIKDYKNIHIRCISDGTTKNLPIFRRIYRTVLKMATFADRDSEIETMIYESLFHQLMGDIMQNFPVEWISQLDSSVMSKNENVIRIVDYLNHHFREKITLDDLTNVTGYNKSYISQIIKQKLGINYYEYLTRVRMREAIFALTNTDQKVSDIAYVNGFSDIKAFNTAFRERFGKTPTEYRKMIINRNSLESKDDKIYTDPVLLKQIVTDELSSKEHNFEFGPPENILKTKKVLEGEVDEIARELRGTLEKLKKIKSKII
ncbi:AraC family transcriptional regulator [Youngiibacter multivorans]|uniref:AraC-like DNA-binding protein n=1 Tax=Youngiibacter multivorans TaxID=937251 RepID=A0ABS4G7J5_9CLOT|nr:AraC family transcriptional regulator [Youngiibacter multivorans]MBP1920532.1 AraC-like DNA-binding protein [Youngiibacter multivorans]